MRAPCQFGDIRIAELIDLEKFAARHRIFEIRASSKNVDGVLPSYRISLKLIIVAAYLAIRQRHCGRNGFFNRYLISLLGSARSLFHDGNFPKDYMRAVVPAEDSLFDRHDVPHFDFAA